MKKKLLFVNGHLNVGGIEKSLVDLLRHLDYSMYDVDLLLLEDKGCYLNILPPQVNVIHHDTRKSSGPFFKVLFRNLRKREFGIILLRLVFVLSPYFGKWMYKILRPVLGINTHYDAAIAYRVGLSNEIVAMTTKSDRKICWWHNGEYKYTSSQTDKLNEIWSKMDFIISVSKGCKRLLMENAHLDEKKIKIIPNIIDIEAIERLAGDTNPYPQDGTIDIVTLGRLCWEKHIEDVPLVAHQLIGMGINNFRWHIIGDGAKRDEIARRIVQNHLEQKVFMHGSLSNPYPYLKYAHLMVHTSYIEAHCLTMLEAMSLKTPCVVTKTMLPQDFTEDQANCLIAEQSVESLTKQVVRMMGILNRSHFLTENAYNMVKVNYSPTQIVSAFTMLLSNSNF